jgi:hypothetical protein
VKVATLLLAGACFAPLHLHASGLACLAARHEILSNFSENRGCEGHEFKALCGELVRCMKESRACARSKGKVTEASPTIRDRSIDFGLRQVENSSGQRFCVVAYLNSAPGEETPSWVYRVHDDRGATVQSDIIEPNGKEMNFVEFRAKTSSAVSSMRVSR